MVINKMEGLVGLEVNKLISLIKRKVGCTWDFNEYKTKKQMQNEQKEKEYIAYKPIRGDYIKHMKDLLKGKVRIILLDFE